MAVLRSTDAVTHQAHGSRFSSYVAPSLGSEHLCAWRLDVPADRRGVAHRPTREEVLLVLGGSLRVHLDDAEHELGPGDVVLVPADGEVRIDGGPSGASAWVTTTAGLEAVLADGSRLTPPWAR